MIAYLVVLTWYDFTYLHRIPDKSLWYTSQMDVQNYQSSFIDYGLLCVVRV